MIITPEFIREKRKDCKMELVIKVDLIMESYIDELVYSGNAIVYHKNIVKHGILMDDFINELRGRGFVAEGEVGRYVGDGSVKVTVPPSDEAGEWSYF